MNFVPFGIVLGDIIICTSSDLLFLIAKAISTFKVVLSPSLVTSGSHIVGSSD